MANPQIEDGHVKIANEVADQLCKLNLSAYESRVLWAIWRKTYGWHKKTDRISYTQFEEITGLNRWHIARIVKKLVKRNIIKVTGNGWHQEYAFQKDYEQWDTNPAVRRKRRKFKDSQGYIWLYIGPNNPYRPMASIDGYILEHRLVMAKALGRCLASEEIVHHKNHIRDHNQLDNLELTDAAAHLKEQFQHRKDITRRCNKTLLEDVTSVTRRRNKTLPEDVTSVTRRCNEKKTLHLLEKTLPGDVMKTLPEDVNTITKSILQKQYKGFSTLLETVKKSKNKVDALAAIFVVCHPHAPPEDLGELDIRFAVLLKQARGDYGYLAKIIWDSSSVGIAGSHLNYIAAVVVRKKGKAASDSDKDDPDKYVKGKLGKSVMR